MPTIPFRTLARLARLAPLALLGACGDPTGAEAAPLAVTVTPTEIRVENRGSRPVYLFALDRERLSLTLWAPCVDVPGCPPPLAPGAVDTTRFDATNGMRPGREAAVAWWYARRSPRGFEPDSVRELIVPL
jgi:hypothetical protein